MAKPNYELFRKIVEKTTGLKVEPEYKFLENRKFEFDFAIVNLKLAIEIEGATWTDHSRHTTGSGFLKDIEKYNLAASEGWILLRFIPAQTTKIETFKLIDKTVKNIIKSII